MEEVRLSGPALKGASATAVAQYLKRAGFTCRVKRGEVIVQHCAAMQFHGDDYAEKMYLDTVMGGYKPRLHHRATPTNSDPTELTTLITTLYSTITHLQEKLELCQERCNQFERLLKIPKPPANVAKVIRALAVNSGEEGREG